MAQVNQLTVEFDTLHAEHQGTLTEFGLVKQKTEDEHDHLKQRVAHLEDLTNVLNVCIQTMAQFGRSLESLSLSTSQAPVSKRFRDIMLSFTNLQPVHDVYSVDEVGKKVEECLRTLMDEVQVHFASNSRHFLRQSWD